jgi:hypothetical protein
MSSFHIVLVLATFLTSLVAGFLFAFAAVVMPGAEAARRWRVHSGVSGHRLMLTFLVGRI